MSALHDRIAKALGWSIADAQSLSMASLRDLVRPVNPSLADEISHVIQSGAYIRGEPGPIATKKKSAGGVPTTLARWDTLMADEPVKRRSLTPETRAALNDMLSAHLDQTHHRLGCINEDLSAYYTAVKRSTSGKKPVVVCWRLEDREDALRMFEKHLQGTSKTKIPTFKISAPDPATMTASAINKELDKLDGQGSQLGQAMIDAGRGYERPSEYLKMTDPLALELRKNADRRMKLRIEIEFRYGPGAPHRLPSGRGFGPRKK